MAMTVTDERHIDGVWHYTFNDGSKATVQLDKSQVPSKLNHTCTPEQSVALVLYENQKLIG